ncbi:hypothetical protein ACSSV4_002797 [Roseovarius sp. MBR-154]|jgi:hypothetical protein
MASKRAGQQNVNPQVCNARHRSAVGSCGKTLALRPDERWWRFGMTAMATKTVKDAGRSLRLALRHALGNVAQCDLMQPRARRQIGKASDRPTLDLFDDEI